MVCKKKKIGGSNEMFGKKPESESCAFTDAEKMRAMSENSASVTWIYIRNSDLRAARTRL